MAWYNKIFKPAVEEKLNPAQYMDGGKIENSKNNVYKYEQYYERLEIVNRAVNMVVDDASEIPVIVGEPTKGISVVKGIKRTRVDILLNVEPNLYQDINTFKRNLFIDLMLDGNIFIYFDGVHLYHLPANKVQIVVSEKTYIEKYVLGNITYSPSEIIHVKDNSFHSIYRGLSRLEPALRTMQLMASMRKFQDDFFANGAVPGLVIKSPNTLSEKIKERLISSWTSRYSPNTGGRRPMILDGGLELDSVSNVSFQELDFQPSLDANEKIILKALGVPPIMLDSGNNANLRPNMRMYYLETVLPAVKKLNFAYERFFGFKITENVINIQALQPELKELATYQSTLVNGGIITPNEARAALGKDPIEGHDELRIPANIAGSATNPGEGGRPDEDE
jgi:HK97 family phage portal protein